MLFEQNGDISFPCNSNSQSGYEGCAIRYEFPSGVLVVENKQGRNKIRYTPSGGAAHLLLETYCTYPVE